MVLLHHGTTLSVKNRMIEKWNEYQSNNKSKVTEEKEGQEEKKHTEVQHQVDCQKVYHLVHCEVLLLIESVSKMDIDELHNHRHACTLCHHSHPWSNPKYHHAINCLERGFRLGIKNSV